MNRIIDDIMLSDLQESLLSILKTGPKTRDELVVLCQYPRTTVFDNLKQLMKLKAVSSYTKKKGQSRPLVYFQLVI